MSAPAPTTPPDPWSTGFQLGDWQVDVSGNRLLRGTELRPLRHKAMELLVLLARHAGRTVTRDEIVDAVWDGNHFVAPKAINTAIWTIRQALGDDPEQPRYLETIAKKGYRLIAPVLAQTPPSSQPSLVLTALPTQPTVRRGPLLLGAALLLALVAAAATWRLAVADQPLPPASQDSGTETAAAQPEALTQEPGIEYLGAISPDGKRLAFAWWRGRGVGELYLRALDATEGPASSRPEALSSGHGDLTSLAWAPDGRSLAFTSLHEGESQGKGCTVWLQALPAHQVPPPPRKLAACAPLFLPILAWSPDGQRIVFSAEQQGAGGLFSMAPDGSQVERLTTAAPAALADQQPSWAPDGSHLAFVRQDPADGTRDLYEWRPGQEPKRLTQLKLYGIYGLSHDAQGQDLIFSSNRQGSRVLLRWERKSGRVVPLGLEGSAPSRSAQGSLVYSLARTHVSIARQSFRSTPIRVIQSITSDRSPKPDPTGKQLAFISSRSGHDELWLAKADGSSARRITRLGGMAGTPSWSASGERLAFVGSCGPGRRVGLCTVELASGAVQALSADAARYGVPIWHPQRDEVWVASDRGGSWQVWRFGAKGGPGRVEPTERPAFGPMRWQADGKVFAYQPIGERALRWRQANAGAPERSIEVIASGEELLDWQLAAGSLTTLTRSDRDRWRRLDLASGRRQALGESPLGTLPERATFSLAGANEVWVELANTHSADLMRLR